MTVIVRPAAHKALITVVVPLFNKLPVLRIALDSILVAAENDGLCEVIIVDHGSTDGSWELAQEYLGRARICQVAGGTISSLRNAGAAMGTGPMLSFLDADVLLAPDYFGNLREAFRATGADASGCECGIPADPHWIERIWHRLTVRESDGPRAYLNSANFAVWRDAFDAIGGFPEDFLTSEDVELCRRLVARGASIHQRQGLQVAHLDNPKSLGAFVRKTYWHGLGAARASSTGTLNLTTVSALSHLAAGLSGLGLAALTPGLAPGTRLFLGLAGLLLIPLLAMAYRIRQGATVIWPLRSLLLLELFLLARAWGALRGLRSHARSTPPVETAKEPDQ